VKFDDIKVNKCENFIVHNKSMPRYLILWNIWKWKTAAFAASVMLATGEHVGKERLQSLCCLSVGQAILFHFQSRYARGFVPTAYARGFVPTAGRHRLCVSRVVPTANYAPGSVPTAATSRLPDSRSNQVSCINVINIYIYVCFTRRHFGFNV
jgi:hypothetical protein